MPTLLYLHGFNSSPESKKAQQTQRWFEQNAPEIEFVRPSLPPYADAAISLLEKLVGERPADSVFVIGSSMGGFFATCLAEQYNLKAVLVNPAVSPDRGLQNGLERTPIITLGKCGYLSRSILMSIVALIPQR